MAGIGSHIYSSFSLAHPTAQRVYRIAAAILPNYNSSDPLIISGGGLWEFAQRREVVTMRIYKTRTKKFILSAYHLLAGQGLQVSDCHNLIPLNSNRSFICRYPGSVYYANLGYKG